MTALFPSGSLFPSSSLFPDPGAAGIPTLVPTVTVTEAGVLSATPGACDAANGNVVLFNNGVSVWLEFLNTSGSAQTVTITIPFSVKGQKIPNIVVTLVAGQKHRRGPFDLSIYSPVLAFLASSSAVTVAAYQTIPTRS